MHLLSKSHRFPRPGISWQRTSKGKGQCLDLIHRQRGSLGTKRGASQYGLVEAMGMENDSWQLC